MKWIIETRTKQNRSTMVFARHEGNEGKREIYFGFSKYENKIFWGASWRSGHHSRLPPLRPGFNPDLVRTWAEFHSISIWLWEFFSGWSGVPPSKSTPSLLHLAVWCCAPRSYMDRIAAARGAMICFRPDLAELRPSQFGLRTGSKSD